jgi:phage FluMu protein Com
MNDNEDLKNVKCPQCKKSFMLMWNDYSNFGGTKQSLFIYSCPSGGTYSVEIHCPHCNYVEEL